MITDLPVSEIMSKELILLDAEDSILEAEKTFRIHHLRHAPVISDGELSGMLSLTDLRGLTDNKTRQSLKVEDFMTPDPVGLQKDAPIGELANILVENEFHAVPILDGPQIVGIVSTTDLIRYLMEAVQSED